VLEKHQIQDILENEDSVGADSSEEEEEFKDCSAVNVVENISNEKAQTSSEFNKDDDEFKDCVEQHDKLEENPESEPTKIPESENTIEFIEDATWEVLAIDALDATADDIKNTANIVPTNDPNKIDRGVNLKSSAYETTSYVVTSAIDNNRSTISEGGSARSFGHELGTPSPAKNRENFRKSKKR